MIETVKTYRSPAPTFAGQRPVQIKVVFDHKPNSSTYVGYWDENGDPHEMNLAPRDLTALLSMLHAADFAKDTETE
ncbi:hypothetical protein RCO28_12665 [Streptomyces sp. LHD-70]|uniref:hypothetical protein n=1 Tax=Streptomyces sp. LHD-70 TaxID=3072140 RepID=UPI00281020A0|nr:hypothetical protein [Streptomyces sp. LHD-70]MDQ8703334.1 hypothetical protein [Streptomyces sp. LHD-70]